MSILSSFTSGPSRHASHLGRKVAIGAILTFRQKQYRRFLDELPKIMGPALVVGSAPNPTRPVDVDPSWFKLSINASQFVLDLFELGHPNLTLFQPKIKFEDETREAYWKVLANKKTDHLIFSINRKTDGKIEGFLKSKSYHFAKIGSFTEHYKNAVVREVLGKSVIGPLPNDRSISNGVFAAILALRLGAEKVVMTGFSMSDGWSHSTEVVQHRKHQVMDRWACRLIVARKLPVFTSDPEFSHVTGIPILLPNVLSTSTTTNPFQRRS
jgi:hypothetical protein